MFHSLWFRWVIYYIGQRSRVALALCLIPKLVHLPECHVLKSEPLLFGFLLYVGKALYELAVRTLQRIIGIDMVQASSID